MDVFLENDERSQTRVTRGTRSFSALTQRLTPEPNPLTGPYRLTRCPGAPPEP